MIKKSAIIEKELIEWIDSYKKLKQLITTLI